MFMERRIQYCQGANSYISIYRLIVISVKIPAIYSVDIDKVILKSIWRGKDPEYPHANKKIYTQNLNPLRKQIQNV